MTTYSWFCSLFCCVCFVQVRCAGLYSSLILVLLFDFLPFAFVFYFFSWCSSASTTACWCAVLVVSRLSCFFLSFFFLSDTISVRFSIPGKDLPLYRVALPTTFAGLSAQVKAFFSIEARRDVGFRKLSFDPRLHSWAEDDNPYEPHGIISSDSSTPSCLQAHVLSMFLVVSLGWCFSPYLFV